ncbi:unnamed protein product, partial [Rangifer tarandus platyrhynchus]
MVQLHPTPSLFVFYCSPLLPHPASPNPSIHTRRPSHPHQGLPAAAPASGAALGSAAAVPAQPAQTGGEGRWDDPPALRSRAPSRMGVASPRPSPQRL